MQRGPALWVLGCDSSCHHPAHGFSVSGSLDRYLSEVRGSQVRVAPSPSMQAESVTARKDDGWWAGSPVRSISK